MFSVSASAQSYWMNHAGGTTIDEGMDIGLDGAGNSYVTGYFTTLASFGPSININSAGLDDVFLAKVGTNGLYQWAVKAGGTASDRGLSIATDATGNSYITGYFYGTATFGSTSITAAGAQDVFIAKYDNTGACLWAVSAGGAGSDIGNGIAVDNSGNIFVTGEFAGTATFGSASLTSMNGTVDVFTTKLSSTGTFLWAKKGSAHLTDRGIDVACDANGNAYVTGQFSDTITFDQVHLNNMLNAVFIVKYDANGNEQWFRKIGGGSMNVGNSITSDGTAIYLTGDFQGTITFFGNSNTTLTPMYFNGIFIAKYDLQGGLTWSQSESSDSPVTSRSISVAGLDLVIGGHFKCTFDSYSDRYAPYQFNSSGHWDIFMGKYTSGSGAWGISRQIGGPKDQTCNGIACNPAGGDPHIAGAYLQEIITPVSANFFGFPGFGAYGMNVNTNVAATQGICNDVSYSTYAVAPSTGSSDIYVGNPLDPNRSLYDFYFHTSCGVGEEEVCINEYNGFDNNCGPDTIDACSQTNLYAATNTAVFATSPQFVHIGPDWTFLWSTGQTTQTITAGATGDYSVVMTSADGCYTSEDTVHFIIHTPPVTPCISDNVVINTNATNPLPITICGDSVLIVGGCFGPGLTYAWYGNQFTPGNYPNDSAWIDTSGTYAFIVTDQWGCSNASNVDITIDHPLDPIAPAWICLNDTDRNDSITICDNTPLFFYPFDSLSNPTAIFECIDELNVINWTISPNTNAGILPYTDCVNFLWQQSTAMVHQTGWYTISGEVIRVSACGSDTTYFSDSLYVEVLPAPPPIPFNLVITGDTILCPGDSIMLVVTGGYDYVWSTMETNDTIYVVQGGQYTVSVRDTVTNGFGCTTISSDVATIQIYSIPQPVISLLPSSGVICPGDSVLAVVSGAGTYVWSGPNGVIPGNVDSIWITAPGLYNAVVTSPEGCQLLSNTVNIQQYNTPSIQASPAPIICPGDSVTLSLVASNGSFVAWLPPLSGSGLTQVVTAAGTYGVSVSACNIITTASITIVQTNVVATITPLSDLTVCEGDSILLGANAGMDSYNWSVINSSDSIVYVYTDGNYVLTTADSGGCEARDTIAIAFVQNQLSPPPVSDTIVCRGMPFHLFSNGLPTLTWTTVNGSVLGTGNQLHFGTGLQSDSTFYVLTNDGVCRSQPSIVNVDVEECPPLTPNVFTPNGDGSNDFFQLYEPEATSIHVWIYDRWGVLIYEYTDLYGSWDGTYMVNGDMCSDGVYYWIATIDYSGVPGKKNGFVHLIRHQ